VTSINIHPSASIDPAAQLGAGVSIGPGCVVGPHVVLGNDVRLTAHVVVDGHTTIGDSTTVYPFAVLGMPPQDLKYKGEPSRLVIGKNTVIREHVTANTGTAGGGMETRIGDNCLLMVGVHVAHDCRIGNHVIMANNATLAGHVTVGDHVVIGGLAAVHQFVRIGSHAMIGGLSGVENDVIPFGTVMGERARLQGLNLVGMKRRGFAREEMHALRHAFDALFQSAGTVAENAEKVAESYADSPSVLEVLAFLRSESSRGLTLPPERDQPGDAR
jgi:UDP-N-acetylglucosamine acyltransferase